MRPGNDAVVIQNNNLSRKEEQLRNQLFNGSKEPNEPPPKPTTQYQKPPNSSNYSQPYKNYNPPSGNPTSTVLANSIPEEKLDAFLNDMQQQITQLNQQQVSMGMLSTQTELLKQHTQILNDNQKQLAFVLSKATHEDYYKKQSQDLLEENRTYLKQLIRPVNDEIEQMKKAFEESQKQQKQIEKILDHQKQVPQPNEAPPQNLQKTIEAFNQTNDEFKQLAQNSQVNLNGILPQNLQTLNNLGNFNIDLYAQAVNQLQKQIQDLQTEAEKAEKELSNRQKKLSSAPPPIPQADALKPIIQKLTQNSENIDFQSAQKQVAIQLGGEFDYDQFLDEVNEIVSDSANIWKDYQTEALEHEINVPDIPLSEKIINDLEYKAPSILDEIKRELGIPDRPPPVRQVRQEVPQSPPEHPKPIPAASYQIPAALLQPRQPSQNFSERDSDKNSQRSHSLNNQKTTIKPQSLAKITSKPLECPKDIKFDKGKSGPESYKSILNIDGQPPKRPIVNEPTSPDISQDQSQQVLRVDDILQSAQNLEFGSVSNLEYKEDSDVSDKESFQALQIPGNFQPRKPSGGNQIPKGLPKPPPQKPQDQQPILYIRNDEQDYNRDYQQNQIQESNQPKEQRGGFNKEMIKDILTEVLRENRDIIQQKQDKAHQDSDEEEEQYRNKKQIQNSSNHVNQNPYNQHHQQQPPPPPPQPPAVDPNAVTANLLTFLNNTFQQINKAVTKNIEQKLKQRQSAKQDQRKDQPIYSDVHAGTPGKMQLPIKQSQVEAKLNFVRPMASNNTQVNNAYNPVNTQFMPLPFPTMPGLNLNNPHANTFGNGFNPNNNLINNNNFGNQNNPGSSPGANISDLYKDLYVSQITDNRSNNMGASQNQRSLGESIFKHDNNNNSDLYQSEGQFSNSGFNSQIQNSGFK